MTQRNDTLYPTYIQGFDKELGGGIPQGQVVLITGCPGTMKSSLAYYILYRNIKELDCPGCYISLEQSVKSLLFQMKRMGLKPLPDPKFKLLDVAKLRKHLAIDQDRPDDRDENWLEVLKKHLKFLKMNTALELLVIDSLPVLEILTGIEDHTRRKQLFLVFEWLRDLELTTFIIAETPPEPTIVEPEEYLADAIFQLALEKVGPSDIQRRIRCVKLRGMDHNTGFFTLEYKNNQFMTTKAF